MTKTKEIKKYILNKLKNDFNRGEPFVIIIAQKIDEELALGGRLPMVCGAMKDICKTFEYEEIHIANSGSGNNKIKFYNKLKKRPLWLDEVINALQDLGGIAHLDDIFRQIEKRNNSDFSNNSNPKALLRQILQINSLSTEYGKEDIFYSVFGVNKKRGFWGLVDYFCEEKFDERADRVLEPKKYRATEGARKYKIHGMIERNNKLSKDAKKHFFSKNGKLFCEICGFDFLKTYGKIGEGFIEAHHIIPLSELSGETENSIEDFSMVCANCHRMLHRRGDDITIEKLKWVFHRENNDLH